MGSGLPFVCEHTTFLEIGNSLSSNNNTGIMVRKVSETNSSGSVNYGKNIISKVMKENRVHIGGSSFGKGFQKATRHYLNSQLSNRWRHMDCFKQAGTVNLNPDLLAKPNIGAEDYFYVVDIGVVISQYY